MWDDLAAGALGAVVLGDTRRLDDCFPSLDFFESRQIPVVLAVNCFDDAPEYPVEEVRAAVDLPTPVPIVLCDARSRASAKEVLATLLRYLIRLNTIAESRRRMRRSTAESSSAVPERSRDTNGSGRTTCPPGPCGRPENRLRTTPVTRPGPAARPGSAPVPARAGGRCSRRASR
jgi:hypothetical protein